MGKLPPIAQEMRGPPTVLMFAPAEREIAFEKMHVTEKGTGFAVFRRQFSNPLETLGRTPHVTLEQLRNSQMQVGLHEIRSMPQNQPVRLRRGGQIPLPFEEVTQAINRVGRNRLEREGPPVNIRGRAIISRVHEGISQQVMNFMPVGSQDQGAPASLYRFFPSSPLALQPSQTAVNVGGIRLELKRAPIRSGGGVPIPLPFQRCP